MGGMFGGGKSQSTTQEVYTGIQVSTSVYGAVIPLIYGRQRAPFNLGWYGDFTSTPVSQSNGGKGGGGGGSTSNDYKTAFLAFICLGPINGINQVWHDKALTNLANENLALSPGGSGPAIWSYLSSNHPSQAIPYDHIAYVASSAYDLGGSASMPNLTFEVDGFLGFSIANGMYDADPAHIIPDYLTDAVHGAGFQGTIATLTGSTDTYQAYVMSLGLLLSPKEDTQRSANSFLQDILDITNSDAVLSVGTLKIIPYADKAVSGSTPDGSSWSYTPNLTPLYSFTDKDYMPDAGEDPVQLIQVPFDQTFNNVNVEYCDRANAYNTAPANANDLGDIGRTWLRTMPAITWHQITQSSVARTAAQLKLNRVLYDRNKYKFRVRADYALVEPMDIVSITDSGLALAAQVVRILEVEDDDTDRITLTVQEVPGTVNNTPQYSWSAGTGYAANYASAPGNVVAPVIFLMPPMAASLSNGITIGIAVCGSSGSAFWGGANVYLSIDGGSSYDLVGIVASPARYGTIGSAISAVADPDTTTTLPIVLANTNLQLSTAVTHTDADENHTLILVGSGSTAEVMSYGTAALTSAGHYNLSYLRRGQYGSADQAHSSGVPFVRLDGNLFQIPIDPGMGGKTLKFKFTSFNTWGRATEDISAVTAYSYTVPSGIPIAGAADLIARGSAIVGGQADQVYKNNGTAAWDGDAYSQQPYPNGCEVSWTAAAGHMMVGLTTDPNATGGSSYAVTSYQNFDYAIETDPAGTAWALINPTHGLSSYLNPTLLTGITTLPTDRFSVRYDGFQVQLMRNGAVLATYQTQGQTYYVKTALHGAASSPAGTAVCSNVVFGQLTSATPSLWVVSDPTRVQATDISLVKISGSSAWDTSAWTTIGHSTCHVSGKASLTTDSWMLGLARNPAASSSYVNGDYMWYQAAGGWAIYESGTLVASAGTVGRTDRVAIIYDGTSVFYILNGVTVRTVADAGKTFYGFSALFDAVTHGGINSLAFGPSTSVGVIDTSQVGVDAVCSVSTTTATGYSIPTNAVSNVVSITCPAPAQDSIIIATATFDSVWSSGLGLSSRLHSLNVQSGATDNAGANLIKSGVPDLWIADQWEFPVAAGVAATVSLQVISTGGGTGTINNIRLQCEVIKK